MDEDKLKCMNQTSEREKKLTSALRAIIAVAVIALLVAFTVFSALRIVEQHEARTVLYRAKTVRLAAWSVSAERYGTGAVFADFSTETGFAGDLAAQVLELSSCTGQVRLLRVAEDGYTVLELAYTEGDYTVLCRAEGEGFTWETVKRTAALTS